MYGVIVNLIGCNEQNVPSAARAILQRWAVIDVDYPTVSAVQKNVLEKEGETRLLIIHVGSAEDVLELKRLNGIYPRFPILAVVDASGDPTLVMKSMRTGHSRSFIRRCWPTTCKKRWIASPRNMKGCGSWHNWSRSPVPLAVVAERRCRSIWLMSLPV